MNIGALSIKPIVLKPLQLQLLLPQKNLTPLASLQPIPRSLAPAQNLKNKRFAMFALPKMLAGPIYMVTSLLK